MRPRRPVRARQEAIGFVVTDHVDPGYWEQRGYDIDAFVGSSNGL